MYIRGSPYNSTNWPNLLQETTFILNSLPNASTALCPHEIMFGTQLRLPLDKWLPVADLNKHVEVQESALSPLFDGPWIVTKRIGVNVHIRNHESGASRVVH